MIRAVMVALASVLLASGEPNRIATWKADLTHVRERLERDHPKVDHHLPITELRREFRRLEAQVSRLNEAEITVELARILARVRDGHTMIPLEFDAFRATTGFRKLPLRLQWFEEGLVVTEARKDLVEWLGARVVAVGGRPLKSALAALAPLVASDGDDAAALRWKSPGFLVTAEILAARKLVASPEAVTLTLEREGRRTEVTMNPEPNPKRAFDGKDTPFDPASWRELQPRTGQLPPRWRFRRLPWAFEAMDQGRTLYLAFNKVADTEEETFEAFCGRLFQAGSDADRLVVDLRWNTGGNGTLIWPLLEGVRAHPRFSKPGGLVVLIGPHTFSAGMMVAVKLEQTGVATFIGEPTSASPNHFGDTTLVTLPHHQIALIHSGTYWQLSHPEDRRSHIQPHRSVRPRLKDFLVGVDTALASAILPP